MALFDQETQSKECPKCQQTFKGLEEVKKAFFNLGSTKDGYARVCKKCYYIKADPAVVNARTDKAMERKYAKFVAAEPIKERPAGKKAYTHSDADIRAIEQSTGLKFLDWDDMGDSYVPRFGKQVN